MSGPTTIPTFRFNWVATGESAIQTWLETPDEPSAVLLFLREGALELTQHFDSSNAGSTQVQIWNDIQVVDELDELRNADGTTLARGSRDTSFAEPGGA